MPLPLKALPPCDEDVQESVVRKCEAIYSTDETGDSDDYVDEKTIIVLATEDLTPLENVKDDLREAVRAIRSNEWLTQYNAIETFRRGIVLHQNVATRYVQEVIAPIQSASLNLRSAMSKNALLALAECFEYAYEVVVKIDLTNVVDALLKRASCEKKFLRDAAEYALGKLAKYAPSVPVLCLLAQVADCKSSKLCSAGCSTLVLSLQELCNRGDLLNDNETAILLIRQVVKFRSGKDIKSREDGLKALVLISQYVGGSDQFDQVVGSAVSNKGSAMKIITDTKMAASGASASRRSRSKPAQGLRERMEARKVIVD